MLAGFTIRGLITVPMNFSLAVGLHPLGHGGTVRGLRFGRPAKRLTGPRDEP